MSICRSCCCRRVDGCSRTDREDLRFKESLKSHRHRKLLVPKEDQTPYHNAGRCPLTATQEMDCDPQRPTWWSSSCSSGRRRKIASCEVPWSTPAARSLLLSVRRKRRSSRRHSLWMARQLASNHGADGRGRVMTIRAKQSKIRMRNGRRHVPLCPARANEK